jgi:hypothetical protein
MCDHIDTLTDDGIIYPWIKMSLGPSHLEATGSTNQPNPANEPNHQPVPIRRSAYFRDNFYLGLFIILFFLILADLWFKVVDMLIKSIFGSNSFLIYFVLALVLTLVFIHLIKNILKLPITVVT